MPNQGVLVLAAAAVVFAVYGSHGNSHSYAYNQGFKTGTVMRQRSGMPMQRGNRSLLAYCRSAPYIADIPASNATQWLAGYDAGCDGQ